MSITHGAAVLQELVRRGLAIPSWDLKRRESACHNEEYIHTDQLMTELYVRHLLEGAIPKYTVLEPLMLRLLEHTDHLS